MERNRDKTIRPLKFRAGSKRFLKTESEGRRHFFPTGVFEEKDRLAKGALIQTMTSTKPERPPPTAASETTRSPVRQGRPAHPTGKPRPAGERFTA